MGRKPRSHLDLMKPNSGDRVCQSQQKQKMEHDKRTVPISFEVGAPVFVKNFTSGPTWLDGTITKPKGHCSYKVKLSDGRIVCRHSDHIRTRTSVDETDGVVDTDDPLMYPGATPTLPIELEPQEVPNPSPPALRRSNRNHQPPDRFVSGN